jgi:HEAT repeat protein
MTASVLRAKGQCAAIVVIIVVNQIVSPQIATPTDGSRQIDQVETLWLRWKAGDQAAIDALIALGPVASELSHQLLYPEGAVQPMFPEGRNRELFRALMADVMPELIKALPEFDEIDREDCLVFLDKHGWMDVPGATGEIDWDRPTGGRMVRPLENVLVKLYESETEFNRDLILRILARANAGRDLRVAEMRRLFDEHYFTNTSRLEFPQENSKLDELLEIYELRPEPAVRKQVESMAYSHPDGRIRERALEMCLSGNEDPATAVDRLVDAESLIPFEGELSSRVTAMQAILEYKSLPQRMADRLVMLFYASSYDRYTLDPSDLCEALCRCESLDEHSKEFINVKVRELLSETTSIEESCNPRLVRVCAAAVVLRWFPDDEEAASHLARTFAESAGAPLDSSMGRRFHDPRAEAARAFRRVPTQGLKRIETIRDQLKSELKISRGSDFCIECGLTLAALDTKDLPCVEAVRGVDEFTLYRLHSTWEEVQKIFGDRAAKLIDLDQARQRVDSEEFISDSPDPWTWQRLQPVASEIIPLLKNHLASPKSDVRIATIRALRNLGVRPDLTVPLLMTCLDDESIVVQIAAIDALQIIGPSANAAVARLKTLTESTCLSVRIAAIDALACIDQANAEHAPRL